MTEQDLSVQRISLSPPSLQDLAVVIQNGIKHNFTTTNVNVSIPPDLRDSPFYLAGAGLSGNVRIADIGGQVNLLKMNFDAKYDLLQVSKMMDMSSSKGVLIGAGAGPFHVLGYNSELMPNMAWRDGHVHNCTRYAKVLDGGEACCEKIGSTGFGLMCNLLGCDGDVGELIHIKAKGRVGKMNFTQSIQDSIKAVYGEKLISVGGVFVIHKGKAELHVMPDFPDQPFRERADVENWLKFYDTDAPLVCLSVLHSGDDRGLGLRMEHTHCFAVEGEGPDRRAGHYHGDLEESMEVVEYEGWFNVADTLYRIDQPAR